VRPASWLLVGLVGLLSFGCKTPPRQPSESLGTPDLAHGNWIATMPISTSLVTRGLPAEETSTPTTLVLLAPSLTAEIATTPPATVLPQPKSTATIEAPPTPVPASAPALTQPASTATPTATLPHLTLTILYDNNAYDGKLNTAWGFSCLVEGLEQTILFDTGGDGDLLLRNMRGLALDPDAVDIVVISHVHADHVGGLTAFLEEKLAVTVYLPQSFPEDIKGATRQAGAELVQVCGPTEVCAHAFSTGELGKGMVEQALLIETAQGLVVITGCAHPGIVHIVRQAQKQTGEQVHLVVGGMHLANATRAVIADIVKEVQQQGVRKVSPCHCSGEVARKLFEEIYGDDFFPCGVGMRLEVAAD
jgi:7,8-dihydropterin-6-yl-methyl-4-(beta-D-ribofuranosyl)aminobenzene 5'-phosphate synthase